jgi:hypothetical protein
MGYPDPKIAKLLKTPCSPQAYQAATRPNSETGLFLPSHEEAGSDYWHCIPRYLLSRCPICEHVYEAQIDTYSLERCPKFSPEGYIPIRGGYKSAKCAHFVGAHLFTHLNGNEPVELEYGQQFDSAEVPAIQLDLMSADIDVYAVLHALPVCRLENEQFVSRYTLYYLFYFSEGRDEIWSRSTTALYGAFMINPQEPEAHDLADWVRRGRLKWLDLDDLNLPLRHGPPEALPYANIQGRWKPFRYFGHDEVKGKGIFYEG